MNQNESIILYSAINYSDSIELVGSQLRLFKDRSGAFTKFPGDSKMRIISNRSLKVPYGFFLTAFEEYGLTLEHFIDPAIVQPFIDQITSIHITRYHDNTTYNDDTDTAGSSEYNSETIIDGIPSYKIRHFHL